MNKLILSFFLTISALSPLALYAAHEEELSESAEGEEYGAEEYFEEEWDQEEWDQKEWDMVSPEAPCDRYAFAIREMLPLPNDIKPVVVEYLVYQPKPADDEDRLQEARYNTQLLKAALKAALRELGQDLIGVDLPPMAQGCDPLPIRLASELKGVIQRRGENSSEIEAIELGIDLNFPNSTLTKPDSSCYYREGLRTLGHWKKLKANNTLQNYPRNFTPFLPTIKSLISDVVQNKQKYQHNFRHKLALKLQNHPLLPHTPPDTKNLLNSALETLKKEEEDISGDGVIV